MASSPRPTASLSLWHDAPMRTVPLGEAGVEVSALCLGCMFFGTRVDEETSMQLLDRYLAAGGSFLDTANNYAFWVEGGGGGESEMLWGRWMRRRGNRDQLFLATKVGGMPGEDLSRAAITAAVEGSLRRLGTDRIDLYYAHIDHRTVALEETLDAFGERVTAGKVRYIGAATTPRAALNERGASATPAGCRGTAAYSSAIPTYARAQAPASAPNWSPMTSCWTSAARIPK